MADFVDRILYLSDGTTVGLQIHVPEQVAEQEWVCRFGVGAHQEEAFGLDGLQALLCALDGVRAHLTQNLPLARWIGGEDGDFGVPRMVPYSFGLAFSQRVDKLIDYEVKLFVEDRKITELHQSKCGPHIELDED